ncbi:MAG: hypothetical protein ACK5Q5_03140 [Planctomycetaceae bacterium]
MMQSSEERYVIQFPHPGREHRPDSSGHKAATLSNDGHGRLFVEQPGGYVCDPDQRKATPDVLHFWCEWECESTRILTLPPGTQDGFPRNVFRPSIPRRQNWSELANTDPCVFGRVFRYCVCKMTGKMLALAPGSVILFGSKRNERFVLDTVFVVAGHVPYGASNWRTLNVEPQYRDVGLAPLFGGSGCAEDDRPLRLYEGATLENTVGGMFSFFPCKRASESEGFSRPMINLQGIVNPQLGMGLKIGQPVSLKTAERNWRAVAEQVLAAGLHLGVGAEFPQYS